MSPGKITVSLLTLVTIAALPVSAFAQSANQATNVQCRQIIVITSTAVADVKSLTRIERTFDQESPLSAANVMNSAASKLQNLVITDPILQAYISRFLQISRQASQATVASENNDRRAAQRALMILQDIFDSKNSLVTEIKNYCGTQ